MGDLGKCLVKWVISTQLNTNNLTNPCSSLSDLSDGILFFTLLNSISSEIFNLEGITLEIKSNNWVQKLSNLRRLKKALDYYTEEVLNTRNSKYDKIDLPLIARTSNPGELIKLFEYVMFVVVNCPLKTLYIRRIMELDESVQMQLMFFIQKVMGEEEESPKSEVQKHEYEQMKAELHKTFQRLTDLEQDFMLLNEEHSVSLTECQQLRSENKQLIAEIERKSDMEIREDNAIVMDLRARLAEKDEILVDLKKTIEARKKKFESEISQLKDELDIASSKALEASNFEKMMQQYKKKFESFGFIKQQNEDLTRQVESLTKTINSQCEEIEMLITVKMSFNFVKESLEKEKSRAEILAFSLETKEKAMKKLEKANSEYKQKVAFLQKQNEELMAADYFGESSHGSDDSFAKIDKGISPLIKEKPRLVHIEQFDIATNEVTKLTLIVAAKKEKIKELNENLKMLKEDFRSELKEQSNEFYEYEKNLEKILKDNAFLSEEIQKLNETLKDKDQEQFIREQLTEELEKLKSSKIALMSDYKSLTAEKEVLSNKFLSLNSELFRLNSSLTLKDTQIQQALTDLKAKEEQIKALKANELLTTNSIENLELGSTLKLNCKINELKSEISSLSLQLSEKSETIASLTKQNQTLAEESNKAILEAKARFDKEAENMQLDLIRQADEATSGLEKQNELLVNKLQTERRNTIMNFQRAMSIKDPSNLPSREVFRLREVLMEKEKEITKLTKSNREIKKCWKISAKLLKAVWKELGIETQKIENAVKERMSI